MLAKSNYNINAKETIITRQFLLYDIIMIIDQKRSRGKRTSTERERERERINRMNLDTLIEATFDSKIAHRNTIRHLINDIDMLEENKQSLIWVIKKLSYNELPIYISYLSTSIS
jgi:hypothetical protein